MGDLITRERERVQPKEKDKETIRKKKLREGEVRSWGTQKERELRNAVGKKITQENISENRKIKS